MARKTKKPPREPLCHALILPAPLHNPKTACGIEMSATGLAAGHAEGTEVLGVRGPDERITCAICQLMLGSRPPSPPYTWDPVRVPTIQELSVEHGVAVNFPLMLMSDVIVAGFLDMMRTNKAENFLLFRWCVSFGDDEKYAEMRANHPTTEWDQIEVVSFVRKTSTPTPETLATERLARIQELEAELRAANATDGGRALMEARAHAYDALLALDTIAAAHGWQLPKEVKTGFPDTTPRWGFVCTQGHSIVEEIPARWWMGEGDDAEACCVGCMPAQIARATAAIEANADAMMREATRPATMDDTEMFEPGYTLLTPERIKANHEAIDGAIAALQPHWAAEQPKTPEDA